MHNYIVFIVGHKRLGLSQKEEKLSVAAVVMRGQFSFLSFSLCLSLKFICIFDILSLSLYFFPTNTYPTTLSFCCFLVFKPEELRQALMPTLESLYRQDPESLPFRQPVDPTLLGIPVGNNTTPDAGCFQYFHLLKVKINIMSNKI